MKANTALGLFIAGAVLALDKTCWWASVKSILVAVLAAIGTLTLLEYAIGGSFGIDEALFKDTSHAFNAAAGRMSPFTATAFCFLSAALALRGRPGWLARAAIACSVQVGSIGALAVAGYVFNATELVTDEWAPPVALHTGIIFSLLSIALIIGPKQSLIPDHVAESEGESRMDTRLFLAFSCMAGLLLAMSGLTYRFNAGFVDAASWVSHSQEVRLELGRMGACLNRAETILGRFVLRDDQSLRQSFDLWVEECRQSVRNIRLLVADNAAQVALGIELESAVERRLGELKAVKGGVATFGRLATLDELEVGDGPTQSASVVELLKRMDGEEVALLSHRQARQAWQRKAMLASLLASLALLTGTCALVLRSISRQLHESAILRRRAEEAARAKAAFLSTMSHEIRTPMTGVLGMVDLLAMEPLNDIQQGYVRALGASGRHLLTVVNDILDYSKIESGSLVIEQIVFSVADVVERVRSSLHPKAHEAGLWLNVQLAPELASPLYGDPSRLTQVLLNLVSNAVKFTERGGVTLIASSIAVSEGARMVRFEVCDTGIGIPAEALDRLFVPFSQADNSISRRFGGSGLGLAICERLVEAMGGSISVESAVGLGSRFYFELLYGLASDVERSERPVTQLQEVRPCRLLIAEDVATNRDILRSVLERQGYSLTFAENGQQALALARHGGWDLVLMDIQMPLMDGVEATRCIRRLPGSLGQVPIVGLTANVLSDERQAYLLAGMCDCVTKPIEWPRLFDAIARHARGQAADKGAAAETAPAENAVKGGVCRQVLDAFRVSLGEAPTRLFVRQGLLSWHEYCNHIDRDICVPAEVALHAHKIRGSAGTLGLIALSDAAAAVEVEALRGEVRPECSRELRELLSAAELELADWR